jgi:hypothetical protein
VIDAVGGGTMVRAASEQQALGACVESLQGHVISPSLHGWHLSSNLRTSLARLIAPFSSSGLDLRATDHIQRCGQSPRGHGVYVRCCSLPAMDQPLPLAPGVVPTAVLSEQTICEMISSYRKPQRSYR